MKKRIEYTDVKIGNAFPHWFEYDSPDGELRPGTWGVGEVSYEDGSVYRGTLLFRDGTLNKYGFGEQDFTSACQTAADFGADSDKYKPYKFVGEYDYIRGDWIFGNGVMYFTDKSGKPAAYATGRFCGTGRFGDYEGEFFPELLLPGFEGLPQIELTVRKAQFDAIYEVAKKAGECKSVLVGDSWFEFYSSREPSIVALCGLGDLYETDTAGKSVVNLGIGGTTYIEWAPNIERILKQIKFDRLFFNLGFNDLHFVRTEDETFADFVNVAEAALRARPDAKIFVNAVCPAPAKPRHTEVKARLNKRIKDYCAAHENFTYLPSNEVFLDKNGRAIKDLADYFATDGIHLNRKGYERWTAYMKKYF